MDGCTHWLWTTSRVFTHFAAVHANRESLRGHWPELTLDGMKTNIDMGIAQGGAPALLDLEELLATRLLVQGNSGSENRTCCGVCWSRARHGCSRPSSIPKAIS